MNRAMNRSLDYHKQLPRIQSQKRVHTAKLIQDKISEVPNKKFQQVYESVPINGRLKRTLTSANNFSKISRQDTVQSNFGNNIEQIQKENCIVLKKIRQFQEEIQYLRKQVMNQKRISNQKKQIGKCLYRKNIDFNNQNSIKSEIKQIDYKKINLRDKIDKQTEKNSNLRKQIDIFRKQIKTLKGLNNNLQLSFQTTIEKYTKQYNLSMILNKQLANKNELLHKTKIVTTHKKGQIIKQYDRILKTIQKQLQEDKQKKNNNIPLKSKRTDFYVTNVDFNSQRNQEKNIVSKLYPSSLEKLKQKLANYEEKFNKLKQITGFNNVEEITRNFRKQYEILYKNYQFISKYHEQLTDLQAERCKLEQRKKQVEEDAKGKKTYIRIKEVQEVKQKIRTIKFEIKNAQQIQKQFEKIYLQIKNILRQPQNNLNISTKVNEENILPILYSIYQEYQNKNKIQEYNSQKNILAQPNRTLDELLESVKRDTTERDHLLSRQQLKQLKQVAVNKKKKNPRGKQIRKK